MKHQQELAKQKFSVTAVDPSEDMIKIATKHAQKFPGKFSFPHFPQFYLSILFLLILINSINYFHIFHGFIIPSCSYSSQRLVNSISIKQLTKYSTGELDLRYECSTVEEVEDQFDIVVSSEVVEHVPCVTSFVSQCAERVRVCSSTTKSALE